MAAKAKTKTKPQEIIPKEEIPVEENLPSRDALDDFFFHAADFIYRRRTFFISLAIALAVIFAASYGIFWFIGYQDNKRSVDLYQIERILDNKNLEQSAINAQALPKLEQYITQNGGSKQAIIALFYKASINFKAGKLKNAERDFKAALQELDHGTPFHVMASLSLANVLRDQGNIQSALSVLEAAKSELMTDAILIEMAEVHFSMNQRKEARSILEILIKDYPSSIHAQRAQSMLNLY